MSRVLSPLLFTTVLEALSREFCQGVPWELLYADDLGLIASNGLIVRKGRLAWFGHLERKDTSDCVSDCREMEVAGSRGKGRPVKT